MQRLTKYRIAVALLALCGVAGGMAAATYRMTGLEARDELAAAKRDLAEAKAKASTLEARMKAADAKERLSDGSREAERKSQSAAIGAFAKQAQACEAIKNSLHLEDKADAHS